jgi:PIN domain nuclease of toxin-antitoxin system
MSAVLDTHTTLWSVFDRKRISQAALQAIRRSVSAGKPLLVSAISLVETIYLVERGRIPLEAFRKLEATLRDPASGLIIALVDEDVAKQSSRFPGKLFRTCRIESSPLALFVTTFRFLHGTQEYRPQASKPFGEAKSETRGGFADWRSPRRLKR